MFWFCVCETVNNAICTLRYKGSAIMRNSLTGIRKQLSSLNVRIRLVISVCHLRECVSLSFQIVLALLLSGKTFLARSSNRNKGNLKKKAAKSNYQTRIRLWLLL